MLSRALADALADDLDKSIRLSAAGKPNTKMTLSEAREIMNRELTAKLDRELMLESRSAESATDPTGINTISDDQLFYMFKQRFGRDAVLHKFINDLGLRSTDAAVSRVVDILNATCQPLYPGYDEDYDDEYEDYEEIEAKQLSAEEQLQLLVDQLNELMIVAKARLIYVDYPETATISIQITMTFNEEEDQQRLQQMEELIMEYKPKGLVEIEVSLTNKVVY